MIRFPSKILLAPMAGVADVSFRRICRQKGFVACYTEMVSAKGLVYQSPGTKQLLVHEGGFLGVQLFGNQPDIIAEAAQQVQDMGFDVIDINMGCPVSKVVGSGEGSALMKTPELAIQMINVVKKAVRLPVTAKIRLGWDEQSINYLDFAKGLVDVGLDAIALHARTRAQGYSGKATWQDIEKLKLAVSIPVIGSGDVFSAQDAISMLDETHCDAVMVARGALGNPWISAQAVALLSQRDAHIPTIEDRIDTAIHHAKYLVEVMGEEYALPAMRKHVSWYVRGTTHAGQVRNYVNHAKTLSELQQILNEWGKANSAQ